MVSLARPADALVVDASVAAKWHLQDEDHVEQATLLLERFGRGELELLAPTQIRYEVPSTFTAATLGQNSRLAAPQARAAIEEFLELAITVVDDDQLVLSAFDLTQQSNCALYDALYVALSQRLDIPFITADNRLYQRIRHLPDVIWIADYQ
jgi:predicted nucleic acid-binding protein